VAPPAFSWKRGERSWQINCVVKYVFVVAKTVAVVVGEKLPNSTEP
jgi:hypothetical protein